MEKSSEAFRTISEVAEWLDTPAHVLRFWESKFTQVKPVKRAGGRRYYRPSDMELIGGIKRLLHDDGMTIKGVQKILREKGVRHVAGLSPPLDSDFANAPDVPATATEVPEAPMTVGAEAEDSPQDDNVVAFSPQAPSESDPTTTEDAATAAPEEPSQPAEATTPADEPAPELTETLPEAPPPPAEVVSEPEMPATAPAPAMPPPAVETPPVAPVETTPEAASAPPEPEPAQEEDVSIEAALAEASGLDDIPSRAPISVEVPDDPADTDFPVTPGVLGAVTAADPAALTARAAQLAPLVGRLEALHARLGSNH